MHRNISQCFIVCPQSLEVLLRRPEDNRNQIRELAQTLMDGGVLDELIQQKLDAFNIRWDELMARVRRTNVQKYQRFSHIIHHLGLLFDDVKH